MVEINKIDIIVDQTMEQIKNASKDFETNTYIELISENKNVELYEAVKSLETDLKELLKMRINLYIKLVEGLKKKLKQDKLTPIRIKYIFKKFYIGLSYVLKRFKNSYKVFNDKKVPGLYKILANGIKVQHNLIIGLINGLELSLISQIKQND